MFCVLLFIAVLMQSSRQDGFQSTIQNGSYCLAPQYRSAEIFKVDGVPVRANSIIYQSFFLTVICPTGFKLVGKKVTRCVDGQYLEPHGFCHVIEENNATAGTESKLCEVPHHPKHGSYSFTGKAHPDIELAYFEFNLELKCNHGYTLQGENYVGCYNGSWIHSMPTCLSKYGYIADPLESGEARLTYCKPPDNIKHGSYVVEGDSHPFIPNAYTKFYVFVTCNDGYRIYGEEFVRCQSGVWSAEMPICGLPCQLKKDPRVEYFCENGKNMETCKNYVNPGEIVTPVCKDNVTRDDITVMRCGENGYFDHVETCAPENKATECGLVTVSDGLIIGGSQVEHGEVPWHAGVYTKTTQPSMQICGGTIVSPTSVISAAHCFWSDNTQVKPATEYAVAVGKIYRPWNDPHDIHAQKSDVLEIKIPILYFGSSANYQNDIAVLKLATSIKFNRFIRPICLDFTEDLYSSQLEGLGKVAGWGLKSEEGNPSQTLKAVFLPVVALDKCVNESPVAFKPYITADKICAGYTNGTAVCKGDSGGGLVFHRIQNGVYKYYLHGIVSTAPNYGLQQCNAFTWATFTSIIKHKGFVYSNIK